MAIILLRFSNSTSAQCSGVDFRRGCCSHHLGVCGCNKATNHQQCCDGAISPTCLCGQ